MFQQIFQFGTKTVSDCFWVHPDTLYSSKTGYGFLTEENISENELLQIPELNNGFEVWHWYVGHSLLKINQDSTGCFITHKENLPLSFKANVPTFGSYKLTITISAGDDAINDFTVFTGRRHLALHHKSLKPHESYTFETITHVCDFIPRGKEAPYTDNSICVTVLGQNPKITALKIEEVTVPTIYVAGDSTLTDQTGSYPYLPENCYCGWGQFLSFFLNNNVAVSNHAHSGLTTESFRSEGHHSIVEKIIKPGDFFLLQFGHNDQKLDHLTAFGGYRENVLTYIREIRQKKAFPILITPLCRNTWKGSDGSYNDLLKEYANVIREIGKSENIPVIDLHKKSYDFITNIGLEDAKRYFFPGDYTHTNDFGAYKMANFITSGFSSIHELKEFVGEEKKAWIPPLKIEPATPPVGYESKSTQPATFEVKFTDIETCENKDVITKLTAMGIIPNTETSYRPTDIITRVEALNLVIKAVNFFPTNVYNDMFEDVVGHEWYAGIVECAWSNGIIDNTLVDKNFYPHKEVTYEEMVSFAMNGYKSRKALPDKCETILFDCSDWAIPYYKGAHALSILSPSILGIQPLTRQEAASVVYALKTLL